MKKVLIFAAVIVAAALLVMMVGFRTPQARKETAQQSVLLLVEDDTGAYFMQLQQGIRKALSERNCSLTTELALQSGRLSTEWQGREYSGALVFIEDEAVRRSALDAMAENRIPTVTIDSWDGLHSTVCQDETAQARLLADAVGGAERVYVCGGGETLRQSARIALGERFAEDGAPSAGENCAVAALDSEAAQRLIEEKSAGLWDAPLIAVAPVELSAAWLESGLVQALVIPSPYAAGYIAASRALWSEDASEWKSPAFIVRPEDMYDAQNVKLVFPLLN